MNDTNTLNPYLKTKVLTAPPEELRLLLIDGAVKFARQARDAMINKNYEKIYEGFTNARTIVLELSESINPEADPDLAQKIKGIYLFIYGELFHSSIDKDIPRLEKAIELLEFERETWSQFLDKLAEERASGTTPAAPPTQDTPRAPFSVQA